jgi:uncharacterized protein YqcC (DUF446 family)
MTDTFLVVEKINEVQEEMKRNGLWVSAAPGWVREFGKRSVATGEDFSEWLQFIYLPNRKLEAAGKMGGEEKKYIAPQATKFFGADVQKGKLLQLLIELDSLP